MTKENDYEFIKSKNIWYLIEKHKSVFNMDELKNINLKYPEYDAKNVFLTDDKKSKYYLISLKNDKKVDIKEFKNKYNTRHLSFARENDLKEILGLTPGSVTLLGILNDSERKVSVYIDQYFLNGKGIIGVHPLKNDATVWLKTNDLINIVKEHGNEVNIIEIRKQFEY